MENLTVVLSLTLFLYFSGAFAQTINGNATNTTNSTNVTDTLLFQTSIHLNYGDNEFVCGGSIVSSNLVLTLASCMYYVWGGVLPPLIITVVAGRSDLNSTSSQQYEVEKIVFHSGYSETTLEYNLALIQIKDSFTFNANIHSALMKSSSTNTLNNCYMTGWNNVSSNLQVVQVNTVTCGTIYPSSVLCAQTTFANETICNHHLGSSLVCNGELVGILSIEPSCTLINQVAVFERLSSSVKWLQDNNAFSSAVNPRINALALSIYGIALIMLFLFVL